MFFVSFTKSQKCLDDSVHYYHYHYYCIEEAHGEAVMFSVMLLNMILPQYLSHVLS